MNHPTEPPQLVNVLIGITAVMAIPLSGVTLGVLSNTDCIYPHFRATHQANRAPRRNRWRVTHARYCIWIAPTGREANRGATKLCQQTPLLPGGQSDADAGTELCSPQPMQIDSQKLLVLWALWRLRS